VPQPRQTVVHAAERRKEGAKNRERSRRIEVEHSAAFRDVRERRGDGEWRSAPRRADFSNPTASMPTLHTKLACNRLQACARASRGIKVSGQLSWRTVFFHRSRGESAAVRHAKQTRCAGGKDADEGQGGVSLSGAACAEESVACMELDDWELVGLVSKAEDAGAQARASCRHAPHRPSCRVNMTLPHIRVCRDQRVCEECVHHSAVPC